MLKLSFNKLNHNLMILGLSFVIGMPAVASDLYEWTKDRAEQGFKVEQAALGSMYYEGKEVQQNDSKALEWSKKAAEQGVDSAQALIGKMYYEGRGVKQDYSKAFEIFKTLADEGFSTFQSKIALMYFDGEGVEQSNTNAFKWARKSVYQTNGEPTPTSIATLGAFYEFGVGVRKNEYKAKELFERACENGSELGCDGYKRLR